MQKGSKPRTRPSSLQDTHRKCVPEQIPVLQSPSILTSVQHADPCHMQFLIHLDTTENNGPGEEEQGDLARTMNVDASTIQTSLTSLCQGPQTGPNHPSL